MSYSPEETKDGFNGAAEMDKAVAQLLVQSAYTLIARHEGCREMAALLGAVEFVMSSSCYYLHDALREAERAVQALYSVLPEVRPNPMADAKWAPVESLRDKPCKPA